MPQRFKFQTNLQQLPDEISALPTWDFYETENPEKVGFFEFPAEICLKLNLVFWIAGYEKNRNDRTNLLLKDLIFIRKRKCENELGKRRF